MAIFLLIKRVIIPKKLAGGVEVTRVIVVTSGKGGVGKTSLTLSIGRGLAAMGFRVVLMDTDIGLNNMDVLMNVENKITFDIADVISGKCRPRQALVEDEIAEGLFVMPSVHGYKRAEISGQNLKSVISSLTGFDYALIDCPAGIELGFHRAVAAASEALVVTTPHVSAVRDASKVIGLLGGYRLPVGLIINRVRGDMVVDGEMASPEDIRDAMGVPLVGVIPENDEINGLSGSGERLKKGGSGSKAVEMLCRNIVYGTNNVYDVSDGFKGLFGGIKRYFKKHL